MVFAIATILKPFAALLMILLFAAPGKRLVQRYMKDGKLKRFLLWEMDREKARRDAGEHPLNR